MQVLLTNRSFSMSLIKTFNFIDGDSSNWLGKRSYTIILIWPIELGVLTIRRSNIYMKLTEMKHGYL